MTITMKSKAIGWADAPGMFKSHYWTQTEAYLFASSHCVLVARVNLLVQPEIKEHCPICSMILDTTFEPMPKPPDDLTPIRIYAGFRMKG